MTQSPYYRAQVAFADLKSAASDVLGGNVEATGTSAKEVGRILGINMPHFEEPTQLVTSILQALSYEGLAKEDKESKRWFPA